MRDVNQYFELLEKAIEYSSATEVEFEILRFSAISGLIEGVVYFADGSRLEFTEQVVLEQRRPVKQEYRYQFMQGETAVFRYDNAHHHQHIATYPHHKHAGGKILPSIEPELRQMLDEALALVNEGSSAPGKKRRQRKPAKN